MNLACGGIWPGSLGVHRQDLGAHPAECLGGTNEMCPQISEMYPQMYPQTPSDCGTLLRTPVHFKLKSTEEKKKKAGRLLR